MWVVERTGGENDHQAAEPSNTNLETPMLIRGMWLASGACGTIPRKVRGVASQLRAPRRGAAAALHARGQTRRGFASDVRDTRGGTVYAVAKAGTETQPPLLPPNLPSYGASALATEKRDVHA